MPGTRQAVAELEKPLEDKDSFLPRVFRQTLRDALLKAIILDHYGYRQLPQTDLRNNTTKLWQAFRPYPDTA